MAPTNDTSPQESIAIVGMAGRFPKAKSLDEFWRNLREGVEAVSFFEDDAVQWLPLEHAPRLDDPRYVRARGVLGKPEWFDAAFFGLNPREAAIMDPQHRVFLECAWEALENAGINPDAFPGLIGVFAGASMNTYLFTNLLTNRNLIADYGLFSSMIMNDGDFVPTRVSYKLNLRGPSINVQTACSTSLVAVCLAAQNLLGYRCDVALAGGVSITFPPNRGQFHLEGGILSKDGHCRAFDAEASGTVLGDGAGIVVLKRLSEALADGDRIYAVIKGTAINNDGAVKIGYTAPSADGQAEAIAMAHAEAGFAPETVSYIEAHGTGTPLGDPIEIAGLTKAFGLDGSRGQFCAIGSVKSNLGHLDIGAGIAGLIKTVLALQHGEIPPSLHFRAPNPKIDFTQTPFFVNHTLKPWPKGGAPRRAGVSSFGIGGTNAHVALEEPPTGVPDPTPGRPPCLLLLSARTPTALEAMTDNLAAHLEREAANVNLADVAYTLHVGRKVFAHRRALVCADVADAVAALRARDPQRVRTMAADTAVPGVAVMFTGQGAQTIDMARELYLAEKDFRAQIDRSCEVVRSKLGIDLREILFPSAEKAGEAARLLNETRFAQPALFMIEYALAQLWLSWGVKPQAMLGHSLGEYVAACVAGVFSPDEALALVCERARLMQAQPAGAMLAVRVPEARIGEFLGQNLALAAVNAPGLCVVSGPFDAIEALEVRLAAGAIPFKRLATSHAFHSAMMEPALKPLTDFIRRLKLHVPKIPFVSNVSGRWITPEEATSAEYWGTHLRRTVRFADGVAQLVAGGCKLLVEIGPGATLAGLAKQHPAAAAGAVTTVASLGRGRAGVSERTALLKALGELWLAGTLIDWRGGFHRDERRQIVPLPTYPFERQRYWIEPGDGLALGNAGQASRSISEPEVTSAIESDLQTAARAPECDGSTTLAMLRALFQELSGLDLSAARPEMSFFELGFDSLFLTQASLAVQRKFGAEVTFRELRDTYSNLAKLAARLEQVHPGVIEVTASEGATVAPLPAAEKRLPVTDVQREIWFASQLGTAMSSAYNEASTLRLAGSLDEAALERALQALVARHEALRATFTADGAEQIVAARAGCDLVREDVSGADAAARDARVAEIVQQPFDLIGGPLFRAALLRFEPQAHVLVLAVHHIVCDGWSLGIMTREIAELYSAEVERRPARLAVAPRFSEYAARHEAARTTPAFAAAEEFWRRQFADEVPVLELPTDRPRPAERSHAGGFELTTLSPEVTAAVKRLCAERECTPFTALLAVFAVLLHRLSGQDDVVVGVPSTAQVMDGVENLVGHFANLLPIRSRLQADERFGEFLAATRTRMTDALEHWRYPFGRLLQQLALARDASRVPLAPVVFNTTRRRGALHFAGLEAEVLGNPKRYVNFDLNFNFALTDDTISLGCYYSAELYDAATIRRWFGHFETLLRAIAENPERPVAELPLLTDAERRQLLHDWNDTAMPYAREATIPELFEAQVRRTPEAVALVAERERVTYAELDRRAERLAQCLRAAGIGRDAMVGIFLERTPELLVAIFGVLKAGGGYVPLDPAYPRERIEFIVADTRMPVLVTQRSLQPHLPAGCKEIIFIDDEAAVARPKRETAPPAADSLAYVIYTSGSTGRPKGVCLVHRCVTALAAWAKQLYTPEELSGVLFSTSAAFDISIFEIFCPLLLGGKIVLAENILQAGTHPAADEITFLSGVPSAMTEVVRLGLVPKNATTVALAGELFPSPLVEALYALPQIKRVFELYGPTEATVYSTGAIRLRGSKPSLGKPFPNERCYVLDRRLQPVPIGVAGELCIAGDKLARGYLNRPELTAEKFVELPWMPGERVYRTGDGGRWLVEGTLEFTGRLDHQVKIRGFRVEPGEVENVLLAHPGVAECVVLVRPDSSGNNRLLAYVTLRPGSGVDAPRLRQHAQQRLPDYMVPAAIVPMEKFPLTSNGKLDRRALPEPEFGPAAGEAAPPRTTTEELLVEIWRDVLQLPRLGIDDNFFELGGHSLLAAQVITRVNDALGVELGLRQFFTAPTIARLAPAIEEALLAQIDADEDASGHAAGAELATAKE